MPAIDLSVLQKIGQDFQEVRFTASEEAGNPYAHLRSGSENSLFICREEICEMLL